MTATKPLGYSDEATPVGSPTQILQESAERAAGRWVVTDTSGRRIGDQRGYVSYRDAQAVGDAHFRATKNPVEYRKVAADELPAPAKRSAKPKPAPRPPALQQRLADARETVAQLERELARSRPPRKAKKKAKRTPVRNTGEAQVTTAPAHVPGHTQVRSTRTRRVRRAVERPATPPVAEGIALPAADEAAE